MFKKYAGFFFFLFSAGLLALAAASLFGCGDLEGSLSSISISPVYSTIGINKAQIFSVTGKDSLGNNVAVSPTFTVTGNIGTISSNGLFVAGTQEGKGTVIAAVDAYTAYANVTVTLEGWVAGRVTNELGNIVSGIKVMLDDLNFQSTNYFSYTNSSGDYSISGVPAGTYEVLNQQDSVYKTSSVEVTVGSGETERVNLTLFYFTVPPTITPITSPF